MKKLFVIGILLIVGGLVWTTLLANHLGVREWEILLLGIFLGIIAGLAQGFAIGLNKRGKISNGLKVFLIIMSIVVLVFLKIVLNVSYPSYLSQSQVGISLSIVFAIGGLLLGRAIYVYKL